MGEPIDDQLAVANVREYQKEILAHALRENVICSLDTGSGKTQIAVMLIKQLYRLHLGEGRSRRSFVTFFVTDRVPLAVQQGRYLERNSSLRVATFHGEMELGTMTAKAWSAELMSKEVIVFTAQLLVNLMARGLFNLAQINLLVIDECHHTRKKHPFQMLMRDHYYTLAENQRPKVFGMTASPISSKMSQQLAGDLAVCQQKIAELEKNLACKLFTVVANREELRAYVPRPKETAVEYDLSEKFMPEMKMPLFEQDGMLGDLLPGEQGPDFSITDTQVEDNVTTIIMSSVSQDKLEDRSDRMQNRSLLRKIFMLFGGINYAIANLGPWCTALALRYAGEDFRHMSEYREWTALNGRVKREEEGEIPFGTQCLNQFSRALEEATQNLCDFYQEDREGFNKRSRPMDMKKDIPSKMMKLVRLLRRYRTHEDFSGIIFVQRRVTANILVHFINACPKLKFLKGKVGYLTGRSGISTGGMDIKQQNKLLSQFRHGEMKLMIATSVAEEGLDVAACRLAVRFDPIDTPISYIQSRGRARHVDSQFIAFVQRAEVNPVLRAVEYERMLQRLHDTGTESVVSKGVREDDSDEDIATPDMVNERESVVLLTRFCIRDLKTQPAYSFVMVTAQQPDGRVVNAGYTCEVSIPGKLHVLPVVGELKTSKIQAKYSAATKMCRALVVAQELDPRAFDRLPKSKFALTLSSKKAEEEYNPAREADRLYSSVKTNRRTVNLFQLKTPECLATPPDFNEEVLYASIIVIARSHVKCHRQVALLTTQPLELNKLHSLPLVIYPNYGIDPCLVTFKHGGKVKLTQAQVQEAKTFHLNVFNLILKRAEEQYEDNGKYFLLVPLLEDMEEIRDDNQVNTDRYSLEPKYPAFDGDIYLSNEEDEKCRKSDVEQGAYADNNFAARIDWTLIKKGFSEPPPLKQVARGLGLANMILVTEYNGQMYIPRTLLPSASPKDPFLKKEYTDYIDYFRRQWHREIKPDQPLIEAASFSPSARNVFRSNDRRPTKGLMCLVPELCYVFGLTHDFLLLLKSIPAVLFRFEAHMRQVELTRKIGLKVDPKIMRAAITAGAAQELVNYERLEFLGDSYLKYRVSSWLFHRYPDFTEEELTIRRVRYVGNNPLCARAQAFGLHTYILASPFLAKCYQPAGFSLTEESFEESGDVQELSSKTLADVVEALASAYLMTGGEKAADAFLQKLGVPVGDADADQYEEMFEDDEDGKEPTLKIEGEVPAPPQKRPVCERCGRRHATNFCRYDKECLWCGLKGHRDLVCPRRLEGLPAIAPFFMDTGPDPKVAIPGVPMTVTESLAATPTVLSSVMSSSTLTRLAALRAKTTKSRADSAAPSGASETPSPCSSVSSSSSSSSPLTLASNSSTPVTVKIEPGTLQTPPTPLAPNGIPTGSALSSTLSASTLAKLAQLKARQASNKTTQATTTIADVPSAVSAPTSSNVTMEVQISPTSSNVTTEVAPTSSLPSTSETARNTTMDVKEASSSTEEPSVKSEISEVKQTGEPKFVPFPIYCLPLHPNETFVRFLERLPKLEQFIGYTFNNKALIVEALTHTTYKEATTPTYQRLEFLGDAIVEFVASNFLYQTFPKLTPGELTWQRQKLVCNRKLAECCVRMGLHKLLFHRSPAISLAIRSYMENISYAKEAPKVLGDIVESLLAAIFVDCGKSLQVVFRVFHQIMDLRCLYWSSYLKEEKVALAESPLSSPQVDPSLSPQCPEVDNFSLESSSRKRRHEDISDSSKTDGDSFTAIT